MGKRVRVGCCVQCLRNSLNISGRVVWSLLTEMYCTFGNDVAIIKTFAKIQMKLTQMAVARNDVRNGIIIQPNCGKLVSPYDCQIYDYRNGNARKDFI